MALTRLFVRSALQPGQDLTLDSEQAHYLGRALRLRAGDSLSVFSAESGEFSATLTNIKKSSAEIAIGEAVPTATESPLKVHLVQGISRGERMDFVVQKATELGVKRISPVLTEYGVVKLDGSRASKRRDHCRKVAESACEQSGRTRPPLVDDRQQHPHPDPQTGQESPGFTQAPPGTDGGHRGTTGHRGGCRDP